MLMLMIEKSSGKIISRLFLFVLIFFLISGCATINSPQPGSGGSTFSVYEKSYDDIWRAAVKIADRNLTIVENNKEAGILRAKSNIGLFTWGEVVGIFIKPTENGNEVYTINVQSIKRSRGQITGKDWTSTLISGIQEELYR